MRRGTGSRRLSLATPRARNSFTHLLFTELGGTNMLILYCTKIKRKGKQVTVDILLDNETAYLTDYIAIQRVGYHSLFHHKTVAKTE